MKEKLSEIKNIISDMPDKFSSHDFIKKFSKKYEENYIDMLYVYKKRKPFQTVHAQIAKFLSSNVKELGINKSGKCLSEHVFGEKDLIQGWKKTKIII